MSASVENLITTKLIEYLNENRAAIGLPCDTYNNEHDDTGEALWVQPNGGERKAKEYIGGSYKGRFPFTLCYQYTDPELVTGRRGVLDVPFASLLEYLEDNTRRGEIALDETTTVWLEQETTPALSYASEDGQTVEHSAVYILEYHVRKPVAPA